MRPPHVYLIDPHGQIQNGPPLDWESIRDWAADYRPQGDWLEQARKAFDANDGRTLWELIYAPGSFPPPPPATAA